MRTPTLTRRRRRALAAGLAATAAAVAFASAAQPSTAAAHPSRSSSTLISGTGLQPGQVKHVWLIILENKSYDATFTGLNQNSYLWKTLPSQGALLTHYYGTGHFSQDNYISMVSGQAPEPDTQADCNVENFDFGSNKDIIQTGKNAGQVRSPANKTQPSHSTAPDGTNGCTYPTDVPTLFNQFDAAGVTWKGYAQDLHNQPGREDATCGGPGTAQNNPTSNPTYTTPTPQHPAPPGVTSFTSAQPNDQYVAKHFPFPWFHALTGTVEGDGSTSAGLTTPAQGGTDCDANHIANLDSATTGLYHDLKSESTTPSFSWITPNNCSDAHDAVCKGNNLSGAFNSKNEPIYGKNPNPESTTPKNYTGGLYASDLFLRYYIPMIERSPAFQDGGLIDVTFDEGFPPFTYTGNSFNNANHYGPTLEDMPNASSSIKADSAAETINGQTVFHEPTGPNTPIRRDASGNVLLPGPGDNAFIDRPPACTAPNTPDGCVPGLVLGGGGKSPGPRTDSVAGNGSSTYLQDPSIVADDTGRQVTDTVDTTGANGGSPIPAGTFVGAVSDTGPQFPTTNTGSVIDGSFQLVDAAGNPVTPTGSVSSITLSGEGEPGHLAPGQTPDPLFDATHGTPGGGDTGSVLISPMIKPGTVSNVYYNHYSWLRTMEDIFQVGTGNDHAALPAGTVSGGLDGEGHLGFAAQRGLNDFGPDVFSNAGS